MEKLIKALNIFLKYGNASFPTHCEHDTLYVYPGFTAGAVSREDLLKLEELSFHWSNEDQGWYSFLYGSC